MLSRRAMIVAAAAAGTTACASLPQSTTPSSTASRVRGHITTRDGTRLFLRDTGEGRPIVFLSGWCLPSDMWGHQIAALAPQGFRCIAYDRRGHGRSDDPGRGYDYDALASDLNDILTTLDLTGVTLVAHSMAAGEMVRLLTRHGDARIARLLFLAPASTPCLTATIPPAVFETMRREQLMKDFPKWVEDNSRPFVMPETSAPMMAWLKSLMLQPALPVVIETHRTFTEADFRTELPRITRPSLVIHGTRDASAPLELTGQPTARMIPGAKLTVYEGAPHGLFLTHAERLNADIAAFARS